jgi:hypothetical protein
VVLIARVALVCISWFLLPVFRELSPSQSLLAGPLHILLHGEPHPSNVSWAPAVSSLPAPHPRIHLRRGRMNPVVPLIHSVPFLQTDAARGCPPVCGSGSMRGLESTWRTSAFSRRRVQWRQRSHSVPAGRDPLPSLGVLRARAQYLALVAGWCCDDAISVAAVSS